jgi:histone H1/5
MIKEALLALDEKSGSSPYAIAKYMEEKHKLELPSNYEKILGLQLKNSAARGKLIKIKASYKLSEAGKKVTVAKPTNAEKKPKPQAKSKQTTKAKAKAKPKLTTKAAPKAKAVAKKPEAVVKKPEAAAKKAPKRKASTKKVGPAPKKPKKSTPAKPKSIKSPAAKRARKAAAK